MKKLTAPQTRTLKKLSMLAGAQDSWTLGCNIHTLLALERQGFVAQVDGANVNAHGGEPCRLFVITEAGRDRLQRG